MFILGPEKRSESSVLITGYVDKQTPSATETADSTQAMAAHASPLCLRVVNRDI